MCFPNELWAPEPSQSALSLYFVITLSPQPACTPPFKKANTYPSLGSTCIALGESISELIKTLR